MKFDNLVLNVCVCVYVCVCVNAYMYVSMCMHVPEKTDHVCKKLKSTLPTVNS